VNRGKKTDYEGSLSKVICNLIGTKSKEVPPV